MTEYEVLITQLEIEMKKRLGVMENLKMEIESLKNTIEIFKKKIPTCELPEKVESMPKEQNVLDERPCPYKSFADLMQKFLIKEQISCKMMADTLGVSYSALMHWRDNYAVPTVSTRKKLAQDISGISGNSIKEMDVLKSFELSDNMPRAARGVAR